MVAVLSAVAGGAAEASAAARLPCVEKPPCVHVSPDPELVRKPGTIYVYRGYGWRPRARIEAHFGSYCPPGPHFCTGVGLGVRFRADSRGRFTFRLRYGRTLPRGIPRPAGAGSEAESITFASRHASSDAIPTPPPSTPAQRLEARRLAEVVHAARRATRRRGRATWDDAVAAYERQLGRCSHHRDAIDDGIDDSEVPDSAQETVWWAVVHLSFDKEFMRVQGPAFRMFANRLEALQLRDPVLRAGADAWIAAIRRQRMWPQPSFCAVLDRWAESNYDLAQRPVDPEAPEGMGAEQEIGANRAVDAAAKRLRALGGGPSAEEDFGGNFFQLGEFV